MLKSSYENDYSILENTMGVHILEKHFYFGNSLTYILTVKDLQLNSIDPTLIYKFPCSYK